MEMQIDEDGQLRIKRAGQWKNQLCPYDPYVTRCSDRCPHFGEPDTMYAEDKLTICGGRVLCGEISDLREQK